MNKRLIWNFLLLPLALLVVIAFSALLGYLLSLIPYEQSPEDFIGGGYEWWAVILGFLLTIIIVIWWTIRIVRDIIAFKKNRKAVMLNSLFLLIAYSPLYIYTIKNVVNEVKWYYQQKEVTKEVASYKTIELKEHYRIEGILRKEDTTWLFVWGDKNSNSSKQFVLIKNASPFGHGLIPLNQLHVYFLANKKLVEVNNFNLDTTSYPQKGILKTSFPEKRLFTPYYKESRELLVSMNNVSDTLKGFDIAPYGTGFSYLIDNQNNCWFPFSTYDPSVLYVVVSNSSRLHKVYKIQLTNTDSKILTSNNILTISKVGATIYLFTNDKILYFEI